MVIGPFANAEGGIDLSLIAAIVTAVVLYLAALLVFPEPTHTFGPKGPRLVGSRDSVAQKIAMNHGAEAARAAVRRQIRDDRLADPRLTTGWPLGSHGVTTGEDGGGRRQVAASVGPGPAGAAMFAHLPGLDEVLG